MSVWDKTPSTLTSFTPLSSEVQASGNFLTRWLRKGKDDSDQSSDGGSRGPSREVSVERDESRETSLERRPSLQLASSRASLVETSHSEPVSDAEGGQVENSKNVAGSSLERSADSTESKRTLSVLTRLSAILERRTATPQVYRDSDFKQYWMPDSSCRECYDCGDKFTTFRRRHHCRICGQIFCHACCNQELPGKIIGYKGSIRVCDYCSKVVQRYAQKVDPSSDPKVTREVLRKAYMETDTEVIGKGQRRSSELLGIRLRSPGDLDHSMSMEDIAPFDLTPQAEFVSMDMTERKMLTQDSVELRNLWNLMLDPARGVEFQNYRYRLRTYQRCIVGNKLVDWLLRQDKVKNRIQAVAIGQALIDADLLDPILNVTTPFRDDFTLYRPAEVTLVEPTTPQQEVLESSLSEDSAPLWFQEIQTSTEEPVTLIEEHYLKSQEMTQEPEIVTEEDQKSEDSKQPSPGLVDHFDEPLPQQNSLGTEDAADPLFTEGVSTVEKSIEESTGSGAWRTLDIFSDDTAERKVFDTLQREHHDHLTLLTKQLLSQEGLPGGWADIIISTVDRVSLFVKPDIKNSSDDMDIRQYVHIKKIPGGKREQTGYVHGVIFKKNIAHKKMSQHLSNPRTLLMNGSIEYQRVENKMSSLQPQILQEEEFLRKGIAKIAALKPKPDILIVEKSVGRLAQDFLLENGITLIYNVKLSVMERLSRFLQADIVPSIDSLVTMPALGFCHSFSVANFALPSGATKTMLCFDGCATHLGCSITLRGGSLSELKKVKKVINFMIYASYHSRLEICFCMDEYMMPPPRIEEVDFDLDSIKYNRKKDDTKSLQVSDLEIQSKNVNSKEKLGSAVSLSTKNGNSTTDCRDCKDVESSQNLEDVSGGKTISVTEDNLPKTEKVVGENNKIGSETSNLDLVAKGKGDSSPRTVNTDAAVHDSEVLDVNTSSISESDDKSQVISDSQEEIKSGKTEDVQVQMDKNLNSETVDTSVCSKLGNRDIKRTSNALLEESKTDDVIKVQPTQDVDEPANDCANSRIDKGSDGTNRTVVKNDKESMVKPKIHVDELDLKQICDTNSDLLINKCVTSPNLEQLNFPGFDQSLASSSDLSQSELKSDHSQFVKKDEEERNKLKLCMSESVLNCDKSSSPRSDRSPFLRRKVESTYLTDQSDPLHSYQKSHDDSIFQSSLEMEEQLQKHRFKLKKALESVLLSTSPYIHYDLPYLETEQGSKCELRKYFPEEIYWSHHFSPKSTGGRKGKYGESIPMMKLEPAKNIRISDAHELIRCKLNLPLTDSSIQTLVAKFRAYGGRIDVLRPSNANSVLFPPANSQKGNQSKGKENQPTKTVSSSNQSKESEVKDAGMLWERKTDCLDPMRHQRIAVLFSSFSYVSENHPLPCVYPWVVTMEFYGRNDITLGGFLERFCFRPSYECPSDSCSTPMVNHIRRFVHGTGSISVVLKKLNHQIQNGQDNILIWSWCYKCKQVTPVTPMSTDTWNISFAKYLEIRFHGSVFQRRASAEPCAHSLHHDHFQYFGFKDTVASFKYSPIKLKEIKLPPFVISCVSMVEVIHLFRLKDMNKQLLNKATEMYSTMLDWMTKLKAESTCENLAKTISAYIAQQQSEKTSMRELACGIREKLHILLRQDEKKILMLNKDLYQMYTEVEDGMVILKKMMAESVVTWNNKIQDIYTQLKKTKQAGQKKEKDRETPTSLTQGEDDNKSLKTLESDLSPTGLSEKDDVLSTVGSDISSRRTSEAFVSGQSYIRKIQSTTSLDSYTYSVTPGISAAGVWPSSPKSPSNDSYVICHRDQVPAVDLDGSAEDGSLTEAPLSPPTTVGPGATTEPMEIPHAADIKEKPEVPPAQSEEKLMVQETAPVRRSPQEDQTEGQTTDKLSSIKKTLISTIWQGTASFQHQMPFDPFEHYVLPPCQGVPVVVYDHEPSSIIAYSLSCHDYHSKLQEIQAIIASQRDSQGSSTTNKSIKVDQDSVTERPSRLEEEAITVRRMSSGKLSFFRGSSRDLVATHKSDLLDTVRYIPKTNGMPVESPIDETDYAFYSTNSSDNGDKTKAGKEAINPHIEIQFADSIARFYCKVYFAEQFRLLRKQVMPDGEDVFIRSLSRCRTWEAKGGKSGSSFRKTIDDRFILKQMSSMEVESFEKFGPQYFQYIYKSEKQQRPSALAKIVGVYRIGFRNQQTNNAMKQDLLVVENLFYNRNITQTYDLKGSERNRLVKTKSKRGEELVLLDENFLRASVDSPLYILPHSKTMLTLAISHDSQFLSSNLVMDYSLLVGVDDEKKELVVGIIGLEITKCLAEYQTGKTQIRLLLLEKQPDLGLRCLSRPFLPDYIRTFTWDKKLETILKSQFGGQGKMPTVVSPEVYRNRFSEMMGKYFLPVPDQWSGLGRDIDN